MSIQYNKEIFSNDSLALQLNFFGFKEDVATTDSLRMSFHAYDKISAKPIFAETFNFDQIVSLYDHLAQISIIKRPENQKTSKFIENNEQIQIFLDSFSGDDIGAIKVLVNYLSKNSKAKERVKILLESLDEASLEYLPAAHKTKTYKEELKNLDILLSLEKDGNIVAAIKEVPELKRYIAGQPEAIFQNWIERNLLWIFGVEYKNHKFEARKISIFSEADLVMESMDGFIDLIELKRPNLSILNEDKSHKSYYPSVDLSKSLGQCGHYIKKIDEYKMQLQHEHKVKILRPRIKIIIGRTNEFNYDQYEALRMLNCSLNNIQIISYDYLLSCGEYILSNLNSEI